MDSISRRPVIVSPARAVLLILPVVIAAYSLTPFEPSVAEPGFSERVARCFDLSRDAFGSGGGLILHALAFASIGVAAAARRGRRALGWTVALVLPFVVSIEAYQLFLPKRHAHVADLTANLLGAVAGVLAGWSIRTSMAQWRRWYAAREVRLHRVAFAVEAVLLVAFMVVPSVGFLSLDGWDRSYRLMVGNEGTGDRPWLGEIRRLAIYDRALDADDVSACLSSVGEADRSDVRGKMGCLASYDFSTMDRGAIASTGGAVTTPPLIVADPSACARVPGGGLRIMESTVLATDKPPAALVDAIVGSGAFSVELWIQPATLTQGGPARMVSLSADPYLRDFTVGQSGSGLEFRIRNEMAGPNGTRPPFRTGQGVLSGGRQHVIATYAGGRARVYVDGVGWPLVLDHRSLAVVLGLGASTTSGAVAAVFGLVSALLCALPLTVSGLVVFGPGGVGVRWVRTVAVVLLVVAVGLVGQYATSDAGPHMATAGWMLIALVVSAAPVCLWCAGGARDTIRKRATTGNHRRVC